MATMKRLLLVFLSLTVATEGAQLQSYNLPALDRSSYNQGVTSNTGPPSGAALAQASSNTVASTGQGNTFTNNNLATSSNQANTALPSLSRQATSTSAGNSGTAFNQGASSLTGANPSPCRDGEVLHVDGNCVVPIVRRNLYVYVVPNQPEIDGPAPNIPPPKVEHNILFVRLPEGTAGEDPVIVPPPRQHNIVYILKKKSDQNSQSVIEVPQPPKSNPEVYYVNYNPGENPILPGGIDLQTALSRASQGFGQVLGGATSNNFNAFGTGQATSGAGNNVFDFSQTGQANAGLNAFDFTSSTGTLTGTASNLSSGRLASAPSRLYTTP